VAALAAYAAVSVVSEGSPAPPSETLFGDHCASCHESGSAGMPNRAVLRQLPPAYIYEALTTGKMRGQGSALSDDERQRLAEHLSGKRLIRATAKPALRCESELSLTDLQRDRADAPDLRNTRRLSADAARMSTSDVRGLKLSWVFAFPGVQEARAQPVVVGNTLFVGSSNGILYTLDVRSGCLHWSFEAEDEIRGPPSVGAAAKGQVPVVFFGDGRANVYALDAVTGQLRWKAKPLWHPAAAIRGGVTLYHQRLYIPITMQLDEVSAGPTYSCCTGRGAVVALDARTGKVIWRRYTVASLPKERSRNSLGVPQYGPSGAGVWSTLALDERRGSLYFGTGNNNSDPGDENSDAIFALDLGTGSVRWRTQTVGTPDSWNGLAESCRSAPPDHLPKDCPETVGPDIDFTAPVVLVQEPKMKGIIVAGRKDGVTFGLDPDTGRIIWRSHTNEHAISFRRALYFGMMADGHRVIVPSSGLSGPFAAALAPNSADGLYALDAFTGNLLWDSAVLSDCPAGKTCLGIESAPTGFPGVAFAGSMDGYIRAYDTFSGTVIWSFDATQDLLSVNGEHVQGGGIAGGGITIKKGMVFLSSGFFNLPGNVLLAFSATSR